MKTSLRLLHIEDNKLDAELIHTMIAGEGFSCEVTRVDNGADFLQALDDRLYDVILCDYNLPSFDGAKALDAARQKHPDTPFIFVSGTIGEDRAIDALKKGATDYVLKDRLERLVPTIRRALRESEERKTRKRLEEELYQAQKMESLGELASGIAHDFNNILAIVLGHASLAEKLQSDPVKQSESLQTIVKASKRGALLVRQLLTFARKGEVHLEQISLNEVIKEIFRLLSQTLPKTVTITVELSPTLPLIVADFTQVHQVILNLCVNARDAMPDGGVLTLKTYTVLGEQLRVKPLKQTFAEYVAVEVADTGVGMDEGTRRRIFEPFFTTKVQGKGTGLGLAVAFGIVEKHEGFIDVETAPGKGTTFTVNFPVKELTVQSVGNSVQTATTRLRGTESILVVEDEPMLRDLLKSALTGNGYAVLTASDGEEAMQIFNEKQADIALVLCDLDLPKLNGYEVLKRLKEMSPSVKFILAGGYIDVEMKVSILKSGARDFIQKPYSLNDLFQQVRNVLDQR